MIKLGIYIHIPFCLGKCAYCNFYSIVSDKETMLFYVDCVVAQIKAEGEKLKNENASNKYVVDTVYIGGGTPNALPSDGLLRIATALKDNFDVCLDEFTIEINPSPCFIDTVAQCRGAGCNRISIGVQSFCDKTLTAVGRLHTAEDAKRTIKAVCDAGFEVSIDLMVGLPYQTLQDITDFVSIASALGVGHISAYCLSLEKDTPLYFAVQRNEVVLPDDEQTAEMFDFALNTLEAQGFARYEVSNFARIGKRSKHNSSYWTGKQYLGIGSGASGFFNAERYDILPDVQKYCQMIKNGEIPKRVQEVLNEKQLMSERIILGLRQCEGVNVAQLEKDFGINFAQVYKKQLAKVSAYTHFVAHKVFRVLPQFFNVMNGILTEFL